MLRVALFRRSARVASVACQVRLASTVRPRLPRFYSAPLASARCWRDLTPLRGGCAVELRAATLATSNLQRLRIRSLKPEIWADERIGHLSRDARLLLVGLITAADDEGRLRALPSALCGHVFPYDIDAPKRLGKWLGELVSSGIVLAYEHEATPYLAFRHWKRHQKVNRPTPSTLPPPPDDEVRLANAVPVNAGDSEGESLNGH